MDTSSHLSPLGKLLVSSLAHIQLYDEHLQRNRQHDTLYVNAAGSTLTAAYEQLRNASEYANDNLFRQRAIRRFFARNLSFHDKTNIAHLAEELVTELTMAGYIRNNLLTCHEAKTLQQQIKRYYGAYWQYVKIESSHHKRQLFQKWLLDVMSVRCEQIIQPAVRNLAFSNFAFTYLQQHITYDMIAQPGEQLLTEEYPIVLYIAIQTAVLKLDTATIRTALIDSYKQDAPILSNFEAFNTRIDGLLESKAVATATRIIKKNGAMLHMIYSGFYTPHATLAEQALASEDTFEYAFERHITHQYSLLEKMLDNAIGKSIVFLLITKSIIGLAIEVPYDIIVEGHIAWLPLLLNLFFPALFIAASRITLRAPDTRNTKAIIQQATAVLFEGHQQPSIRTSPQVASVGFSIAYGVMFAGAFALLSYILYLLKFNIAQGIIFFIFLSTASFLVFRMSTQIREIEAVAADRTLSATLRDIIYLPFIYVGQQISYRYAKVNIVASLLDMLIEMPLKSVLRTLRHWANFLNSKKDDLL